MKIHIIPILSDNYAYLLEDGNGNAAVIDPGEAGPVIDALAKKNLTLTHILNTHHHGDHIAGNEELQEKYGAKIIAPAAEAGRIPHIDTPLSEDDMFSFGGYEAQILETPGHTKGGICFYFKSAKAVFTGDTLFSMGCGRLFEGTPEQMWRSFEKLMALPDDTNIYCGHEYTLSNGDFCLKVEPDNTALQNRMDEVRNLRAQNKPTIPTTMTLEKKTNVFLRAGSADAFAKLRKMKDAA